MKIGELLIVGLVVAVIIGTGWVKNLIKLTDCDFASPYKTEIVRVIGIIPPVGAVVGWMDIGEENK